MLGTLVRLTESATVNTVKKKLSRFVMTSTKTCQCFTSYGLFPLQILITFEWLASANHDYTKERHVASAGEGW